MPEVRRLKIKPTAATNGTMAEPADSPKPAARATNKVAPMAMITNSFLAVRLAAFLMVMPS